MTAAPAHTAMLRCMAIFIHTDPQGREVVVYPKILTCAVDGILFVGDFCTQHGWIVQWGLERECGLLHFASPLRLYE